MLFGGIVKKYTADLILRTKFKNIIGLTEKFAQNIEEATSFTYGIFTPNTRKLGSIFFVRSFTFYDNFLGEKDFQSSFV